MVIVSCTYSIDWLFDPERTTENKWAAQEYVWVIPWRNGSTCWDKSVPLVCSTVKLRFVSYPGCCPASTWREASRSSLDLSHGGFSCQAYPVWDLSIFCFCFCLCSFLSKDGAFTKSPLGLCLGSPTRNQRMDTCSVGKEVWHNILEIARYEVLVWRSRCSSIMVQGCVCVCDCMRNMNPILMVKIWSWFPREESLSLNVIYCARQRTGSQDCKVFVDEAVTRR